MGAEEAHASLVPRRPLGISLSPQLESAIRNGVLDFP